MNRRDFITKSCTACFLATTAGTILSSCGSTKYISGKLTNDGVLVPTTEFRKGGNKNGYRSFVIVRHDSLQYPICVYRFSETEYSALWMRCTHQGTELQASGDFLQCPAHGSEFNNKGKITSGPADQDLRSFPVVVQQSDIFIDLRKP